MKLLVSACIALLVGVAISECDAWAYLEEVQVVPQRCRGGFVVVAQLANHDNKQTNERCDCQRHGRDDTRNAPCFPHVCGVGVSE